jgi:hypothetical protein
MWTSDPDRAHADAQAAAAAVTSHFSDDEEAFFQAGQSAPPVEHVASESFDDLDVGYQRVGFWDRLVVAEQHALAAVDLVEIAVPRAQVARLGEGRGRNVREFGGELLGAVEEHRLRFPLARLVESQERHGI